MNSLAIIKTIAVVSIAIAFSSVTHAAPPSAAVNHLNQLNCGAGEVAKFDGANWVCAEDIHTIAVQPYCPCFSTDDIENVRDGVVNFCEDFSIPFDLSSTSMGFGGGVQVAKFDSTWSCTLLKSDGTAEVGFDDIGFESARACRLTIINSPSWQECPTVNGAP